MRWLLGLVILVGTSRPTDACTPVAGSPPFTPELRVEVVPPSEVTVTGLEIRRTMGCASLTYVTIDATASDDTTSPGELGFRFQVSGHNPPPFFGTRDLQGPRPVVTIGDGDFDFELRIAAIDSSGNVGPETVVPIIDEAPGCNAAGATGGVVVALVALGLCRRRRAR